MGYLVGAAVLVYAHQVGDEDVLDGGANAHRGERLLAVALHLLRPAPTAAGLRVQPLREHLGVERC